MRRACIDIGSNTTRLLVADCVADTLIAVHQERVFTHVGRSRLRDGAISDEKIREVAEVVQQQLQSAQAMGAEEVRVVATAAVRGASNRDALTAAVEAAAGVKMEILSDAEEARLAYVGVARTLAHHPGGQLGVVDVGGGSSELVVGEGPDKIVWWASVEVGSGGLADRFLVSDPPSEKQLDNVRQAVAEALEGIDVPRPAEAAAVGGSAASLFRLAGPLLERSIFERAIRLLVSEPSGQVAARYGLEVERVKLLPAGLLILQAAYERFGRPLQVGAGGVREGVLLESADG